MITMLWNSVTSFFSDIGDFFSGKSFFEMSGYIWHDLMKAASNILLKDPTQGTYESTWADVGTIYTTLNVLTGTLLGLFFLYGFIKDSIDIHAEMTLSRTFKIFIRLIISINVVTLAFDWIPQFMLWAKNIVAAILGTKKFGFYFDGASVYQEVSSASWGTIVAFLTSFLFFLFTVICGFLVIFTVLNRVIKIYLIAPFCGIALSTLAGGGQISQVGYSYIKSFLGYVFSALLVAVAIVLSTTFINTISITGVDNAIVKLLEYCLKMGAITGAVKGADSLMQKAFGL